MCNPALLLAIPTLLIGVVGVIQSIDAQHKAADTAQQIANNNAQVQDWKAEDRVRQGKDEVRNRRLRTMAHMKRQEAAFAANGVLINDGTSFENVLQTYYYGEVDAISIGHQARVEATYLRNGASNERYRGRVEAARHRNAATGTALAGAGSFLSTSASVYGELAEAD